MPGRPSPMIATALLVAVLPTLPLSASPASAGGPTCRGQQATHVGAPGTELVTTPGPDVVVTNGSELVRTHMVMRDPPVSSAALAHPGGRPDRIDPAS